jgi:TRAP-type C4-dicarboxylate transport system substrate-binding protein
MNMRLLRRCLPAALLVGVALPGTVAAQAAAAPVRIRLGTLVPQGTSYHRILLEMGEHWRTATNGRVQTTVYAGTMGSEAELVRRIRLGQLQAGALTAIGLREVDPTVSAIATMPMTYRSSEEVAFVLSRLEPVFNQRLLEKGFVVLFWVDAGWVRFFTRQAAQSPDDFKRLKLFVTAGETEQFDLMRGSGYQPVALEWTDALTALQTGMIDAVPTIPFYALAGQLYTVANHMLEVNWAPLVGAAVISRRTWESLSPEMQTAMRQAAQDAGRQFGERSRIEGDESVASMRQRGLIVHPMTPALDAEWRRTAESLYPRIRGTMVPAETFDEVMRLLAEYRSRPPSR